MITTLTLIGDRVATAGDFLALGEGRHKTPGWLHLCVDWDPSKPDQGSAFGMDGDDSTPAPRLNGAQVKAITKFCRQYVNHYKADLEPTP